MSKTKKILFICNSAPYGTALSQDMLDIILMTSTFDQHISLLFQDEGVLQLKIKQQPNEILQKKFTAAYQALELYDIKNIYVAENDLQQFNLNKTDLIADVRLKNPEGIKKLIAEQNLVLSF
jgi:tRNA 2-thiouridine synthesizing protein C